MQMCSKGAEPDHIQGQAHQMPSAKADGTRVLNGSLALGFKERRARLVVTGAKVPVQGVNVVNVGM